MPGVDVSGMFTVPCTAFDILISLSPSATPGGKCCYSTGEEVGHKGSDDALDIIEPVGVESRCNPGPRVLAAPQFCLGHCGQLPLQGPGESWWRGGPAAEAGRCLEGCCVGLGTGRHTGGGGVQGEGEWG